MVPSDSQLANSNVQVARPNISALDRLGFTMFLAIALHILMITTDFLPEDPEPAPFTMEITLAQYQDDKKPENATTSEQVVDFYQQQNLHTANNDDDMF